MHSVTMTNVHIKTINNLEYTQYWRLCNIYYLNMADYLSAELTATCAVLGYFDGTNYHLDKNCLGKNT